MRSISKGSIKKIEDLELAGDAQLERQTLESCLSAISLYSDAQSQLYDIANDGSIPGAKPWPAFNSNDVEMKAWHASLLAKMQKANALLVDPKTTRR